MKWFSIIQISFDLLSVIIEIFEKDIAEINLLLQFFVLRQRQRFLWKLFTATRRFISYRGWIDYLSIPSPIKIF